MNSPVRLEREVAAIGNLSREKLVAAWIKAYRCPPPKGIKRPLLERAVAWHLQARRLGGLSPTARKALRDEPNPRSNEVAGIRRVDRSEIGIGDTGQALRSATSPKPKDRYRKRLTKNPAQAQNPVLLRPGSRLMREWNGRMHVVDVVADGYVLDGKTYRSLSAVAKRITGAHWSGPRFFAL
jgi:hypothetical protein